MTQPLSAHVLQLYGGVIYGGVVSRFIRLRCDQTEHGSSDPEPGRQREASSGASSPVSPAKLS